jgi:hypothetical protein
MQVSLLGCQSLFGCLSLLGCVVTSAIAPVVAIWHFGGSKVHQGVWQESSALDRFAEVRIDRAKAFVRYGLSPYAVWAHDDRVSRSLGEMPDAMNAVPGRFRTVIPREMGPALHNDWTGGCPGWSPG